MWVNYSDLTGMMVGVSQNGYDVNLIWIVPAMVAIESFVWLLTDVCHVNYRDILGITKLLACVGHAIVRIIGMIIPSPGLKTNHQTMGFARVRLGWWYEGVRDDWDVLGYQILGTFWNARVEQTDGAVRSFLSMGDSLTVSWNKKYLGEYTSITRRVISAFYVRNVL
jgi:hypothetical protein